MRQVPFVVTAWLVQGAVLDPRLGTALDGLLASQRREALRAARARPDGALPSGSEIDGGLDAADPADADLPLDRCPGDGTADGWHWLATFAVPVLPDGTRAVATEAHYRTGRINGRAVEHAARKLPEHLPEHNGRYRARRIPDVATVSSALVWRGVGDPAGVLELLSPLPAVGAGRARGEGTVRRWQVDSCPEGDPEEFGHLDQFGALARPCPVACADRLGADRSLGPAGLRPPYWHRSRQSSLALPP